MRAREPTRGELREGLRHVTEALVAAKCEVVRLEAKLEEEPEPDQRKDRETRGVGFALLRLFRWVFMVAVIVGRVTAAS